MALNFPNNPVVNQTYIDSESGFTFKWDGTVWQSNTPSEFPTTTLNLETRTGDIVLYFPLRVYGRSLNTTIPGDGSGTKILNAFDDTTSTSLYPVMVAATGIGQTVKASPSRNFVFNAATGNLGIGTAIPTQKLDVSGNINISGSIFAPDVSELYELDDISGGTNGLENTFIPTFNYERVTISDPFKLLITVNGILQSAYVHDKEYVYQSYCVASRDGYTIDHDGNIKFTESLPTDCNVVIKTASGRTRTSVRQYPFLALDIMF